MNKISKKIAILGCGISALSFLHSVDSKANVSISIFEKESEISNRCHTKNIANNHIDDGANYICSDDQEILQLITEKMDNSALIEIEKWVYSFNHENIIDLDKEMAKKHNILKKFNYKYGMGYLSILLLKNVKFGDFKIYFNKKITKLKPDNLDKYSIFSKEEYLGDFDYIISSLPPPNLLKILKDSDFLLEKFDFPTLWKENQYKMIFSLIIGFKAKFNLEFYALINTDRKHAISWLSVENDKIGHINDEDLTVFVVQAADWFVRELQEKKYDEKENISQIKKEFYKIMADLIKLNENQVIFEELTQWEHALPVGKINSELIEDLKQKGIFLIGDGLIGKGRIDGSMKTGIDLYKQMKNLFEF